MLVGKVVSVQLGSIDSKNDFITASTAKEMNSLSSTDIAL